MKEKILPPYYSGKTPEKQSPKEVPPSPKGLIARFSRAMERRIERIHEMTFITHSFSVEETLAKSNKPVVEVGGPTEKGFRFVPSHLVDSLRQEGRFLISNIKDGLYTYDYYPGRGTVGKKKFDVDFAADAR